MAEKISRVLVVLANQFIETDQRNNLINDLCKTFSESVQSYDSEVDLIDLYKDIEFDPIRESDRRDTKIIEYQIRIKKAQVIVFFYQTVWLSPPAILKGFIDKVFVSGFAYKNYNGLPQGLLDTKQVIVVATCEKPNWQVNYIYGNIFSNFWKKIFLDYCGVSQSNLYLLGNYRSASNQVLDKWNQKMKDIAAKLTTTQSFLDFF
ncbi:MAG: NAD(P)H-dependent oxidoreductase [Patescibacteria group bacterium]